MSSIHVVLTKQTCIAGGVVSGEVILNFPLLQQEQTDEVYIKFKGSIYAFISPARTDLNETRDVDIVRARISVWTRGSAYPSPGSHTLSIPFGFNLPPDVPPSFDFSVLESRAVVRDGVEAVGVRPGALRLNKRVFVPVVGLPADPYGSQVKTVLLHSNWTGMWTTNAKQQKIRAGFWGEYSDVTFEFKYPTLESVPIWTTIPFTLTVVTTSKLCKWTTETASGPIWPTPPTNSGGVRLELVRMAYVRTNHLTWTQRDKVALLGGLGDPKAEAVHTQTSLKTWLPVDGQKGRWQQQASFTSSFNLSCSPSFKTYTLSVEYNLAVIIPFAGMKNTVRLDIPIVISSGVVPRPRDGITENISGDLTAPPLYDYFPEHPLALDLPPSYWDATE